MSKKGELVEIYRNYLNFGAHKTKHFNFSMKICVLLE